MRNLRERQCDMRWEFGICAQAVQIALFITLVVTMRRMNVLSMPGNYIANIVLDCLCMLLSLLMFLSFLHSVNWDAVTMYFMVLILVNNVYLFLDAVCWLVNERAELRLVNVACNTLFYYCAVGMGWLFWRFLLLWTTREDHLQEVSSLVINCVTVLGIFLITGNLTGHYYFTVSPEGVYARSSTYFVSMICPIVVFGICVVRIFRQKLSPWETVVLLAYPLLPYSGAVITIGWEGPALVNIEVFISLFFLYCTLYVRRERELIQQKAELTEARVDLMVSQIQPHFVSNTLGMIRSLYRQDTNRAELAMNTFIHYLQSSFSDLNATIPIPVERELEHVRQFTDLELLRWPDMTVIYDVRTTGFYLPAMTIQPLVENAIRHGLMPLQKGGTVQISTYETPDSWCVRVVDDGVGFDTQDPKPQYEDHRKHIGLPNIRGRLDAMCGGSLQIESEPNQGTVAMVVIPKGGGEKT